MRSFVVFFTAPTPNSKCIVLLLAKNNVMYYIFILQLFNNIKVTLQINHFF